MRLESLSKWAHGWWIDYVEGEFDIVLDQAIQMLMRHSSLDRDVVKNYRKVRRWVEQHGDVTTPESARYHKALHSKIMLGIDRVESGNEDVVFENDRRKGQKNEKQKLQALDRL